MPNIGYFALGVVLLLLGGDSMAKGVSGLAQRLGLPSFLAGFLVLSMALSLPDLAVNAHAVYVGLPEVALGNAVGNSVASLGLIVGAGLLIAPLTLRMRWLAVQLVLLLVAAGLLLMLGREGSLARWEGTGLLAAYFVVTVYATWRVRQEDPAVQQELTAFAETRTGLAQNLSRIIIAGAVLFFGGKFLLQSAPALGLAFGLSPWLTGLTLLAVATALPDLFVAAMAARQGQGDIVLGQALGSGLFNLLLVIGGLATWQPLTIPAAMATVHLPALMAMVLLMFAAFGAKGQAGRREGFLLLGGFGLWLALALAWR